MENITIEEIKDCILNLNIDVNIKKTYLSLINTTEYKGTQIILSYGFICGLVTNKEINTNKKVFSELRNITNKMYKKLEIE